MLNQLESLLPEFSDKLKTNLMLKAFSLTKVPLLFATGAKVTEVNDQLCKVKIPFTKVVKNHLNSLYFGALAIGADACVGLLTVYKINNSGEKISLVFKSFEAEFLKRAEGPTEFICEEGEVINELIQEVLQSGQRGHRKIKAKAVTKGEVVANFVLELSLKPKS